MRVRLLPALFWLSLTIVVAIVFIPIARFLLYQWSFRRDEFLNLFRDKTLDAYLSRFYRNTAAVTGEDEIARFETIFNRVMGRHLYYVPTILLAITLAVLGGLVIATAIRSGYEQYLLFYQSWLATEGDAAKSITLTHQALARLNAAVFPFREIALSLQALAAISGAYLYVVGVVIEGYRARTLLSSDLLWRSFRLVIAVPLGLSVGALANSAIGAFVGFALGAFPIKTVNRRLRGLLSKSLNVTGEEQADQLVRLVGVTPAVSAMLAGESISAAQQLASTDPVALAIRSGLQADYVLNLTAQSQAWCYLGEAMSKLAPLGLGDSRSIASLSKRLDNDPPDGEAGHVLTSAAKAAGLDEDVLRPRSETSPPSPTSVPHAVPLEGDRSTRPVMPGAVIRRPRLSQSRA
jgi:hypothetical protein